MTPDVLHVLGVAILTDLATGLGALPFAFVHRRTPAWQGTAYAFAGGMMISAAVFSLAEQGLRRGAAWEIVLGILAGAAFFGVTARRIAKYDISIADLGAEDSRKAALILTTMFVHSIPEGIAIGVGYATGEYGFGLLLALAIAIHNIPEGTAIALPLHARGVSVSRCAGLAILSSVPQPIAAVPAYLLVSVFQPLLPAALGFAGGAMILLVVAEMLPEAFQTTSRYRTAWSFVAGMCAMLMMTSGLGL